ncbi:hypothetical protein DSO57_1010498 [Entomophthora muscae]|uniref:Uncharacterized protein n=1 Tax=Entomophthora muscae TaxID=34485 RepID=A0ACC2T6H3_9FUNG|nr:hypothetical protein DSO57_1010498 [Entomophthora muscae]
MVLETTGTSCAAYIVRSKTGGGKKVKGKDRSASMVPNKAPGPKVDIPDNWEAQWLEPEDNGQSGPPRNPDCI